jgi:hypothetical protein
MSLSSPITKGSAMLLCGAALGGAGGYAASASGASASSNPHAAARTRKAQGAQARLRRAVSLTAIIPTGGGHFAVLTEERGTFVSTSGTSLTLQEGTTKAQYKTVTIPLGGDPVVRLARRTSSLSSLTAGDRLLIVQGPRRTTVIARAPRTSATS